MQVWGHLQAPACEPSHGHLDTLLDFWGFRWPMDGLVGDQRQQKHAKTKEKTHPDRIIPHPRIMSKNQEGMSLPWVSLPQRTEAPRATRDTPCLYFQRSGWCRFGDQCRNSHLMPCSAGPGIVPPPPPINPHMGMQGQMGGPPMGGAPMMGGPPMGGPPGPHMGPPMGGPPMAPQMGPPMNMGFMGASM